MTRDKSTRRRVGILLGGLLLLGLCATARYYWGAESVRAEPPRRQGEVITRQDFQRPDAARPAPANAAREEQPQRRPAEGKEKRGAAEERSPFDRKGIPAVVAGVNSQRITRDDLARECLRRYGKEVLESMVNKQLIAAECRRQGISVTRNEVEAEIERMAQRFGIPVDQWLKMLKQERNVTPQQYADDIIWPTLALRKLAGNRLKVGREELAREFEMQYGPAVRARLIAVSNAEKAQKLQAQAAANPDDFGNLAKDNSEDAPSASVKGMIQPIRKYGGTREIEQAAFNMADGEVSPVIHVGGQYVILKREGLIPARQVKFEQVAPRLEEVIRERKLRDVAQDVFGQLQERAVKEKTVEIVWSDKAKHKQAPDVAAVVEGVRIGIDELAVECIARHGPETLDGMINRKILEQACRKQGVNVTEEDMQAEIARAALAGVKPKPDGSPDIDAWLELVTVKQNIPLELYKHDVVWPTVALKKLVGEKIKITEEELRKGFEANFGPRVRCLAIVLDNLRRAQQVFQKARANNTSEYFGDLAAQYSIEPGSRELHGEVPPIKRYGGQPRLEEEAFQLKPGELSGIIQVGDKFVILRCLGHTKPVEVDFAQVRDEIHRDLHEKKLRLAMAERFESLQASATVDNFLTGESRAPQKAGEPAPEGNVPTLRQTSAGK
jgi:parvulin-like peptidyl-prolyl isomerase